MALTLSELNAVTEEWCDKTPTDIYFGGNVLLFKLLPIGGKVSGGTNIDAVLEYNLANTDYYGRTTSIPTGKVDIFNKARFRWAGYYTSNTIDLDDKRMNTGEAAIIDLVNGKLKNMAKTIRDKMGTDLYATGDASGDDFLGLGNMFSTTTSTTYGGICEDDMSVWAAVNAAASGSLTFQELQDIRADAQIDNSPEGVPNLYITHQTEKDYFERTLQSQARYADHKLAAAGFDNILFGSKPVVADMKQTDGYCDALNMAFLEIKSHSDYFFTKPVWEHKIETPDTETCNIRWSGQLICKNRKAHCRRTGLT